MAFLVEVVAWFGDRANWRGDNGLTNLLVEHVVVSVGSLALAMAVALPAGLVLGHLGRGGALAVNAANVGRAVPSFAVLVIALQLSSIGTTPAVVALVALALPPMVTNAWVGVHGVDADLRQAARGMGMTGRQLFLSVELPLALPVVVAGVRTAAVQVVATATLAAVVGYGGLGALILIGLRTGDNVEVVAGAATVAALALMVDLGLGLAQRALTAEPLRRRGRLGTADEASVPRPA